MTSMLDNLKEAFTGESPVNQKYRAFAKKAEQDGFPNNSRWFQTAGEAERTGGNREQKRGLTAETRRFLSTGDCPCSVAQRPDEEKTVETAGFRTTVESAAAVRA